MINLIEIKNLTISKKSEKLISGSDFNIHKGEVVGLFGDSGSGKSVFSYFLMGFLNRKVFSVTADSAIFNNTNGCFNFLSNNDEDWCSLRGGDVSMVFQNPSTSLNPTMICGKQIKEACSFVGVKDNLDYCFGLLKDVGILFPEKVYFSYPHELSGGQKQRVVIAIALASKPSLLIADEPTTSLDPSTQRAVLDLILKLKNNYNLSVLLISHNIDLINYYCNRVYLFKNSSFINVGKPSSSSLFSDLYKMLNIIKTRSRFNSFNIDSYGFYKKFIKKNEKKDSVLFDIKKLSVSYKTKGDGLFFALKNISFSVGWGECLGVVGSSGSGKTTLGRILCGLHNSFTGDFIYPNNRFFLKNSVQMVYQDPYSSFNPKYTVGNSVSEIVDLYKTNYLVSDLFNLVSLKEELINMYPHELSGGQKQRVSIARVLASNPDVIVFDESISALDIKTQLSILELIRFINSVLKITIIFISHDINSIYYLCNKVIVLKNGEIIDFVNSKNLLLDGVNNYTKQLINDTNFI
ncbi:MAG: hypothetical protein CMP49_00620 [Flavobacteriales bacterium]|nr:hypothetical protein [Flavobacteriales bacterium]|tara:strand:+ start:52120 stop:53682 length:1563 start_codon:yes stop_codon:yes gene_type:complete